MEDNKLKNFKELLNEKKREIDNTIGLMKENKTAEQDKYSPTELSNYDNHPADMASELFQVEFNNGLRVHEEDMLKEVQDALERMDKGVYGKCAFCRKDINEDRLEAVPFTRLCMECENNKTIEPQKLHNDRPNEELVWDAPFGRKYLNEREDDENEGLDYLNDVTKYGSSDGPQDMGGYHDYKDFYTNDTDDQGIVDDMDKISNEDYKKQLPD